MIKATGVFRDRKTLFIGLSFGNLDRFRAGPGDTYIQLKGEEIGLDFDVLMFSGITEADCATILEAGIGPDTKVNVSKRLKQ